MMARVSGRSTMMRALGKIWQPDGVSESLQGLVFAKAVEWFICRGTMVAMSISNVIGAIATANHSRDGPLASLDHC
jgi:hypothetical protein